MTAADRAHQLLEHAPPHLGELGFFRSSEPVSFDRLAKIQPALFCRALEDVHALAQDPMLRRQLQHHGDQPVDALGFEEALPSAARIEGSAHERFQAPKANH